MRTIPLLPATTLVLALAGLLGAGCTLLPGGADSDAPRAPGETAPARDALVRGTIRSIDPGARTLTLAADAAPQQSLRDEGSRVIGFDATTSVHYQGRTYRPEDLEAGDRIEAHVERSGERLMARRIDVLADASAGSEGASAAPSQFDATVRWVDTRNRTVELEPSSGERRPLVAEYDANTRVEHAGRRYRPEDLERGDVVQVRTRSVGGRLLLDEVDVLRDARAASQPQTQASASLLRGTIRQIDRNAQRIALDGAAWVQGFDAGAGAQTPGASVAYDARTVVEYQGRRYGIVNLEPGDEVEIEVGRLGDDYFAQRIIVTRGA